MPVIYGLEHFGAKLLAAQLRPAYYSAYARRLATWGYAVVQYDTGRWPILNDRQEVSHQINV